MKRTEVLDAIVKAIDGAQLKLSSESEDGRINSALSEKSIVTLIEEKAAEPEWAGRISVSVPKIREWYDVMIFMTETGESIPINIKITSMGCDNLNCKLGIFYALSGDDPLGFGLSNETNWNVFFDRLSHSMKDNESDYFFVVIDKSTSKAFWTSLKGMASLIPNGNNLPFQANWRENNVRVNRTFDEAKRFILSALGRSIDKRADIKRQFDDCFPDIKR